MQKMGWMGLLALAPACVTSAGDLGAITASETNANEGSGTAADTDDSESSGLGGEGSEGSESSGGPTPTECVVDVGRGVERRLTGLQYANAVQDVFGVVPQSRPRDVAVGVWNGAQDTSPVDLAALVAAGDEVAAAVDLSEMVNCSLDVTGGAADQCAQDFVDDVAAVALRGQHDPADLLAIWEAAGDFEAGIRAMVEAIVADPQMLSVTPQGATEEGLLKLDAEGVATRLSLFLWNSIPDASLLAAAADGSLLEEAVLVSEVERMLADPRHLRMQGDFYAQLTDIDQLEAENGQSQVFPGWSVELAEAMKQEQRRTVEAAFSDGGSLDELLTSSQSYVNAELAALYGDDLVSAAPQGNAWAQVELDDEHRGGLLTQLGFLTRFGSPADYIPPTFRGVGVRSRLLCTPAVPPPPDVDPGQPGSGPQDREGWEALVFDPPSCAGCHTVTDPMGFTFGAYDGVGRWLESHGELSGSSSEFDLTFDDALDLSESLSTLAEARRCFAQRYYEFALRRVLTERDECAVDRFWEGLEASDGDLSELAVAIATSDILRLARP